MVPFAGWELPVQFEGLMAEHRAVRERCGMFDISHMGVLTLSGPGVKDKLQGLVPSDLQRIGPGEAQYTVLLNEAGGIRDDLIIYDRTDSEVVVVINAACAESDTAWIKQQLEPQGISVSDRKAGGVLLALQGPRPWAGWSSSAARAWRACRARSPRPSINGDTVFAARTGYTGEDG